MRYTTIFLANSGVTGTFSILLLFLFCFLCVHIAKYAKIGWQSQNKKTVSKKPPEAPPPKQEKPAEQSEPIYYIVEKKKARVKHRYSEPREIRFK